MPSNVTTEMILGGLLSITCKLTLILKSNRNLRNSYCVESLRGEPASGSARGHPACEPDTAKSLNSPKALRRLRFAPGFCHSQPAQRQPGRAIPAGERRRDQHQGQGSTPSRGCEGVREPPAPGACAHLLGALEADLADGAGPAAVAAAAALAAAAHRARLGLVAAGGPALRAAPPALALLGGVPARLPRPGRQLQRGGGGSRRLSGWEHDAPGGAAHAPGHPLPRGGDGPQRRMAAARGRLGAAGGREGDPAGGRGRSLTARCCARSGARGRGRRAGRGGTRGGTERGRDGARERGRRGSGTRHRHRRLRTAPGKPPPSPASWRLPSRAESQPLSGTKTAACSPARPQAFLPSAPASPAPGGRGPCPAPRALPSLPCPALQGHLLAPLPAPCSGAP